MQPFEEAWLVLKGWSSDDGSDMMDFIIQNLPKEEEESPVNWGGPLPDWWKEMEARTAERNRQLSADYEAKRDEHEQKIRERYSRKRPTSV